MDFLTPFARSALALGTSSLSSATQIALRPAVLIGRAAVFNFFSKIRIGRLRVVTTENDIFEYGEKRNAATHSNLDPASVSVTIRVLSDNFWVRLLFKGDLGFAEAYMYGEVEVNNLVALMKLFVQNRENLDDLNTITGSITHSVNKIANSRFANTIEQAIFNISDHYDLGNDMFALFLDKTMTYSCALWKPFDPSSSNYGDIKKDGAEADTLENAQLRKLRRVIELAKLKKEHHVLEIGCGWGSLAIEAASSVGCKITTLTLSREQKHLAEDRIREAGLSHLIKVLLMDYRLMDPTLNQFDRIISIEMVEAVGKEFLPVYFECCEKLLAKPNGIMVMQAITMPEARYDAYLEKPDFIQKYIFPGGHCPTITSLIQAMHVGTKGALQVNHMNNFGLHYAKTLRTWRNHFLGEYDNWVAKCSAGDTEQSGYAAAAEKGATQLPPGDPEVFRRKWEYYFAYCEGGYITNTLGVVHLVLTRANNPDLMCP